MQNIEEIYKEYSTAVYKYLFCLTQNKEISEDLTQETFALAVKDIKKFRGDCKLIVRDIDIFKEINKKADVILKFTITSANDSLSKKQEEQLTFI